MGSVRCGRFGKHLEQNLAHSNRVRAKQKLKIKYGKHNSSPGGGGTGNGIREGHTGNFTVIASWEHGFHYTALLYALHI